MAPAEAAKASGARVRSVLYLEPRSGDGRTLVDFFIRTGVLEHSARTRGCLSASIQLPLAAHGPVLVLATWESAEAYEDWVADPWRAENGVELASLLANGDEGPLRGELYRIAHAVSPVAEEGGEPA